MKIGLFGGTFDPPHIGHMYIASKARDVLDLDYCLMIPTGVGYEKTGTAKSAVASPVQRLQMVSLALQGYDRIYPSDVEVRTGAPNKTIETILQFQYNENRVFDTEVWFICGADSWNDLPNWEEPNNLITWAKWAVIPRAGIELRKEPNFILPENPFMEISSSAIRNNLSAFEDLLHEDVLKYITLNKLYAERT